MKRLTLERFCYSPMGTFGRLFLDQQEMYTFYTVEQPWQANILFISCIPEGTYVCAPYSSQKYPSTWEITKVPNRTAILFHVGNTRNDFQGCIGVGVGLGVVKHQWAVTASVVAFEQFKEYLKNEKQFQLKIRQYIAA